MPRMNPEKTRVLVVDDYPQVLSFVRIGLRARGYDVEVRDSGRAALEAARQDVPDVILLDIRMPDLDGFEVIKQLREFCDCPIIAYSATPEFSERALEAGAEAFIPKPFELDALLSTIDRVIKS